MTLLVRMGQRKKKNIHYYCLILIVIVLLLSTPFVFHFFFHFAHQNVSIDLSNSNSLQLSDHSSDHRHSKIHSSRVAVIIPYVGTSLPSWFRAFLFTAQLSSQYFDWYIFVTSVKNISTPMNVHLVYIDELDLANRIIRMDPTSETQDPVLWSNKFLELLRLFPYMLVEYKPALGWIFEVN